MSVATATPTRVAVREFTEAEMRRYFTKPPAWPLPVAIIGGIFLLISLFNINNLSICATIGVVMLAIGGIAFYVNQMGSKPTDEEYDAWVDRKRAALEPQGRHALSLFDESQIVGQILRVDGSIVPTTQTLQSYSGAARVKQGKDGFYRFSINTVKYFYPEKHKLAAYSDIVNALNQGEHRVLTEEYFYTDIVGAQTADQSVAAVLDPKKVGTGGQPVTVTLSAKMFKLIASSGDTTGETVDVASITRGGGSMFRRGDAVEQTVRALRKLLDEKKGAAQDAQHDFQKQQSEMQEKMQRDMLQVQQQMLEQMQRMAQGGTGAPNTPGASSEDGPASGTPS